MQAPPHPRPQAMLRGGGHQLLHSRGLYLSALAHALSSKFTATGPKAAPGGPGGLGVLSAACAGRSAAHTPGPGPPLPGALIRSFVPSFVHQLYLRESPKPAWLESHRQGAGDASGGPKDRKRPLWGSEGRELESAPMCTCAPAAQTGGQRTHVGVPCSRRRAMRTSLSDPPRPSRNPCTRSILLKPRAPREECQFFLSTTRLS